MYFSSDIQNHALSHICKKFYQVCQAKDRVKINNNK